MPQPLYNVYVWKATTSDESESESYIFRFLEEDEAEKKLRWYKRLPGWGGFMILTTMDENEVYFEEDADA